MAKLADALCLERSAEKRAGSSPVLGTKVERPEISPAFLLLRSYRSSLDLLVIVKLQERMS